MATINDFLKKIDITDLSEYVDTHGILTHYSKGEMFVGEGRHCRYIGIVKSGYFKFVAYNSKGQEIVTGFSFVGEVVSDFVRGFLFGQTCLTTIVAGCDAEILLVTIDELRSYLQERNPGFIAHSSSILLQEAYQRRTLPRACFTVSQFNRAAVCSGNGFVFRRVPSPASSHPRNRN